MTGTLTTDAIIFAIHSAIKLGNAFEQAYASSLRSKSIVLPLPTFNSALNFDTIERFFRRGDGQPFVSLVTRLNELQTLAQSGQNALNSEAKKEYEQYYIQYFSVTNPAAGLEPGKPYISAEDLTGLLRIRQWQQGTVKNIRPLQLVSGTLVEIGIGYFNKIPGAIRSDSAYAQVLKSFLNAVDGIDFSSGGPLKETIVKDVAPKLFVSVAESLGDLSTSLTNDEKLQQFIQATSEGLTKDIYTRIDQLDTAGNQEEVIHWGKSLFRSLVKNSGTYLFTAPGKVLGTGDPQSALIQSVGQALMSALLDDESGLDLKNVFTIETLDNIVKSSLAVVAQYPALVSKKEGIKEIIVQVAETVADSGIQQPGLVPELVRMILVNTAGNLDQLWKVDDSNAKHLLVTTLKQLLLALSTGPTSGSWRPKLTNQQILAIAESTFNEVVQNQAWIQNKVNQPTLLGEVLNTTFNALGAIPEGQRLNFQSLEKVIKINLRVVASSQFVLKKVRWGSNQEETTILNKSLDLVFAFVFKEDNQKPGDNTLYLFDLLEYIMDVIVSQHPDEKGLVLTQLLLNANSGVILENGLNKELANQLVKASLGVISANPGLLANDTALQNIIGGVANAFENSGLKQANILGELIRISLSQTSGNLNLIIPDSDGKPKQLIVLALQYILEAITTKPGSGKWRPKLSGVQVLGLSEMLLNEVVQNQEWVTEKANEDALLQEVLGITFAIFEKHPQGQRINFVTLKDIIELTLKAVAINKLILATDPQKETILKKAMDLVFDFVFNEPSTVDKSELLIDVLDYMLGVVITEYPNKEGLIIVTTLLQKNLGIVSSTGINEDLANQLVNSALNALAEHPELVSDKIGIQNIVLGVTSALSDLKITEPGIMSEFIRLVLENTAGNLNLIIDTSKRTQKNILVLALQQILKAASKRPSSGTWKPKLTPMQIFQISEMVLQEILDNPQWVKNNFIQKLIEVVYQSMEKVPKDKPLHYSTIEILIKESIAAVDTRFNLAVNKVTDENGQEKLVLSYALDGFFEALFDESNGTIGNWTLTQSKTLNTIIHYYLSFLTGQPVDKKGMDEAIEKIKKAIEDLNNNVLFKVQDLLDSLNTKIKDIDIPG